MLLNHNQPEATAQTRITPEELAQAITSAEEHKEAELHRQAQTAALQATIEHFELEVTPEQLLADVQAQREQRSQREKLKQAHRKARRVTATFLTAGGLFVGGFVLFITYLLLHPHVSSVPAASSGMSSSLIPLASVSENQPVYVTFSDVVALANGRSAKEVLAAANRTSTQAGSRQWTLLKFRDHFFVRGWRYSHDNARQISSDWLASIAANASEEETGETPVERFKAITRPPSLVDDPETPAEQIYLPDTNDPMP